MTTQSANKIYRMEKNCAIQDNVIRLDSGAYLEFVPEPNIPFGGSRFFQSTSIYLKKDSTLFYWDIIYPGRYARGEEFAYDIYSSSLDIFLDEEQALADTVMIEPGRNDPRSPGVLGKGRFAANLYVYARDYGPYINEIEASHGVTASGILFMRLVTGGLAIATEEASEAGVLVQKSIRERQPIKKTSGRALPSTYRLLLPSFPGVYNNRGTRSGAPARSYR